MNDLATVGIVGAAVGVAKGVMDQKNAQKYDSQAGTDIGSYIENGISNAIPLGLAAMGGYAGVSKLLGKEFTIKGNNIKEIAQSISKNVYPGKEQLSKELSETIAHDPKMSAKWMDERVQKRVSDTLEDLVPKDKIEELSQTVHSATYSDDIDELAKSIGQYTDKADIASKIMKDEAKEVIDNGLDNIKPGLYDKITKYPQAYFKNPDKKVRNARIGTAIGAYTALSVGGRYLQGGTLTTDQYGRKDIAGIPFL